jgi:cell wall-associated NlpC family hydrolase
MTISSVSDIQSRIAAIEQRFGGSAAAAPVVTAATGGVLGASTQTGAAPGGQAFARDLATATEQLRSATGGADPAGLRSAGPPTNGGARVVAIAKKYLGVPYVWGGTNPDKGLDCSGLTDLVYHQVGVDLPRVSWQQAKAGRPVGSMAQARPGDLLAFGSPVHHVGIYMGDGMLIHAPRPGKDVEISSVYETPSAIRRVLPDLASEPAAARTPRPVKAPGQLASFDGPLPAGTPYAAEFGRAAARTGVPAKVLAAVAKTESGYRADAVSPAGARGLMQLLPGTARDLGVNPLDPAAAIGGAARLLKGHIGEFGSLELALAAYNAGQGTVRKYGGIPPYNETRGYVTKVMTILNGSST